MFGAPVLVSGIGDMKGVLRQRLLAFKQANDSGLNVWGRARAVKPNKVRLFSKPDQLSPRIAAVLLRNQRARGRLVAHAAQMLERLAVDQSAEGSRVGWHP